MAARVHALQSRGVSKVDDFFERYVEGANTFAPELMASLYTPEFLAGEPSGVSGGRNDASLRDAFAQRKALFEKLGFRRAKVLKVDATPLDARYTMAKVQWQMTFEKEAGKPRDFVFFITYFLFDDGTGPRAAFWISHEDEERVMRDGGLLPAEV